MEDICLGRKGKWSELNYTKIYNCYVLFSTPLSRNTTLHYFIFMVFYVLQLPRLFVTTGLDTKACGTVMYFLKAKPSIALGEMNISNDVIMGSIDMSDGEGLLSALNMHLQSCIHPPVRATKDWGQLLKEPSGTNTHGAFLGIYGLYSSFRVR